MPAPRVTPPRRRASPPASSRPRSRRSPSCSRRRAMPPCRRCSTRSRWRRATRWRSPPRSATTSMRRSRGEAPRHWRLNAAPDKDPALPAGVEPLGPHVEGPPELTRRLAQIGVVAAADGARLQRQLKTGQRLVSAEGHLWRWDGFIAAAQVSTAAATRLAERSRLGALAREEEAARAAAETARNEADAAAELLAATQSEEKRLRQLWREAQGKMAQTRDVLTAMERQARETEAKIAAVSDARGRAEEALVESHELLGQTEAALAGALRHGCAGGGADGHPGADRLAALQRHRVPHRAHHARARASRPHRAQRGHRARARALEDALGRRRAADRDPGGAQRRGRDRDRQAGRAAGPDRGAAPEAHERACRRRARAARRPPTSLPPPTPPSARRARSCAPPRPPSPTSARRAPAPRPGSRMRGHAGPRRRAASASS